MQTPVHAMAGNLMWTRDGGVWANWVLRGVPYGLKPVKAKREARAWHQALFRQLRGEALLLGVRAGLDPALLGLRMMEGVDADEFPEWAAECVATMEWLDEVGPGQRVFWLSVPLGDLGPRDRVLAPLQAVKAEVFDRLGLPRAAVSNEEVLRRLGQASRVAEAIPGVFDPAPATPGQMVWLHEHSLKRGLGADMDLPEPGEQAAVWAPKGSAALGAPVLDEGGQSDFALKERAQRNPLNVKYLKVSNAHTATEEEGRPSYQRLMVISDTPEAGIVFPDSELLGRIDECGQDVDWALRLTVRSSEEVASRNRRALQKLHDQYDQRDGEVSHALNTLDRKAQALAEYQELLDSDKLEVETQATIIFAVGGSEPDEVRLKGRVITDYLSHAGYKLATPLGFQTDLWWAMCPGVPANHPVREFCQITTSRTLSALMPMASVRVGDTKGSALGLNIGHGPLQGENRPCGPTSLVFHDLFSASDRQMSGSLAVAGELGAGKTATLMSLSGDVIDRGGQLVIVDRTNKGEWLPWAQSVTQAVVVDPTAPEWSLDPLRMFSAPVASRAMNAFLTPLLNVPPTSPDGVLLSDVLHAEYRARHQITSAGALLRHLMDGCDLPGARDLAGKFNVFARHDLGQVIFNENIPTLDLGAAAVVARTATLPLPKKRELEHEHLFKQLTVEKLMGRALHSLLARIAKEVCFADTSRLGGFVVSEAHALTASDEALEALIEFVRDGRKHRAVALLDSHDPAADFGTETLRGLIPTRLQMRQSDKTLAEAGLRWLGMANDDGSIDQELIDLVTTGLSPQGIDGRGVLVHRRGEGLLRDMNGNIAQIKVQLPLRPHRAAAITAGGTAAVRQLQEAR